MSQTPIVAELSALDSCAVSDALDSLNLPPAVIGLAPLTVSRKLAGRIVTVKLGPVPPPEAGKRHLGTAAVESAESGDVVVIEHSSGVACAGWGGVLSAGAQLKGIAGVVIDGPARDIDEAREIGFPIYGRGPIARTARGRIYEQDFGCEIEIGGVRVWPGDFVLADSSGVVFLRPAVANEVVRRAKRVAERERLMVEALKRGEPITEVVGRDYEQMLGELE